jgi:hypothetical protein
VLALEMSATRLRLSGRFTKGELRKAHGAISLPPTLRENLRRMGHPLSRFFRRKAVPPAELERTPKSQPVNSAGFSLSSTKLLDSRPRSLHVPAN